MSINKQRLDLALSTIQMDEIGFFSSSKYVDLICDIHLNAIINEKLNPLRPLFSFIDQDVRNLQNIILRLDWQKSLYVKKEIDETLWMNFSACDIDYFHVEFRSFFDYLAKAVRLISDHPEQIPQKSFNRLKNWIEKNESKIETDLADIILSCEWFNDLKEVRECLVHNGGFTLVFLTPDRITFQVIKGWKNEVLIPEIMYNENVVDFELYAGLYFGYLIAYLEEVSEIFDKRLDLKKMGMDGKKYHPGLEVIQKWIEKTSKL